MIYMVNPSKRQKKSKRRNPELLIVNPYSLGEERESMAKKRRKRKSRSKRRRNPLIRWARRKNPNIKATALEILGPGYSNLKTVGVMTLGGGLALGIAQSILGSRVDTGTNLGKGAIALAAGLGGGILLKWIGELAGKPGIGSAAIPAAMGAMVLGAWTIAEPHVATLRGKLGFAGWTKEFEGYSPYGQSYYDEFTKGVAPGMAGFGQPVVPAADLVDPEDNPFLSGYEPMGDIINSQRLGGFEAESGFGGFVPETANARDQQVADVMKNKAGVYGGYEMGEHMFDPMFDQ